MGGVGGVARAGDGGRSLAVVAVAYVLYRPTDPTAIRDSSVEAAEATTDQRWVWGSCSWKSLSG